MQKEVMMKMQVLTITLPKLIKDFDKQLNGLKIRGFSQKQSRMNSLFLYSLVLLSNYYRIL